MMPTFTQALAPFVADGSLIHYYPLSEDGRDVVGGLDAASVGGVTFAGALEGRPSADATGSYGSTTYAA